MLKLEKNQHLGTLLTVAQRIYPDKCSTSLVRKNTFIEISTNDKHEVGSTF